MSHADNAQSADAPILGKELASPVLITKEGKDVDSTPSGASSPHVQEPSNVAQSSSPAVFDLAPQSAAQEGIVDKGLTNGQVAEEAVTLGQRSPSRSHLSPSRPISFSAGQAEDGTRRGIEAEHEKRDSTAVGSIHGDPRSALLNLPPPLPFDLQVSNLWVGVPHRGPSSYVDLMSTTAGDC